MDVDPEKAAPSTGILKACRKATGLGDWIASRRYSTKWANGDRISLVQERDHEEFTRDHKQLMTWQVLMQEKMDRWAEDRQAAEKRLNALSEKTDQRIAELVGAIRMAKVGPLTSALRAT